MDSTLTYAHVLGELLDYTESAAIQGMQQLSDYDEISEVLRAHRSFVQGAYDVGRGVIDGSLTLLDGPPHKQRRKLLSDLVSEEALSRYRDLALGPTIERVLTSLARDNRDADGVVRADLVVLAQRCVHQIAAVLTGIDGLDDRETEERFINYVQTIGKGIAADWSREDRDEVAQAAEQALDRYRVEFFEPAVARRKALLASGEETPTDLIGLMYSHWDDAWSAELPLHESAALMVGATQTTALSLVLLALRLDEWFVTHPQGRERVVNEPEFLRHATHESLRMTVPAPARVRLAVEDVRLKSGREIKAGERVALLMLPANLSERRFGANPATFDPERRPEAGASPWGLSFGAGAHVCLGRAMATGPNLAQSDGVVAALARGLYEAGLEVDGTPQRDERTHYPAYQSVPVRFTAL